MRTEQSGLRFRKGDAAVTAAVVLFAIGMLAWMLFGPGAGETAASARVYQDGQMIRELSLREDTEVTVEGLYTNRITVRGGRIAITESSCPGGTGPAGNTGKDSYLCGPKLLTIIIFT